MPNHDQSEFDFAVHPPQPGDHLKTSMPQETSDLEMPYADEKAPRSFGWLPKEKQEPLEFSDSKPPSGFVAWRAEWEERKQQISRRIGLVFGRLVEINLTSGIVLRGQVILEPSSFLHAGIKNHELIFRADGSTFTLNEVESCVVLDDEVPSPSQKSASATSQESSP